MFLPLAVACHDYDLSKERTDPDVTADAGDTATAPDSGGAVDTGDAPTGTVTDPGLVATEPVYINTSSTLYSYDPATRTAARIGDFRDGGTAVSGEMTDIAISLDGLMYGGSFTTLYQVDPVTAECTRIARLDDEMTGLTFVSDGRLVGAGEAVSVVDTATGALTPMVRAGQYSTSGDIIGLPDGMLYWTVRGGDDLVQVDPADGSTRRLGSVGVDGVYGLGYADGELLGFTSSGRVVVIDEGNGHATDERSLSGSWWGATTNPVLW